MMLIGSLMLLAGGFLYFGLSGLLGRAPGGEKFAVSNARYYTDFDETEIELTYNGTSPVNASVTFRTIWEGVVMNWTKHWQVMKKGDTYNIGCRGYSTSCWVIYDDYTIEVDFTPKHTTISESPP